MNQKARILELFKITLNTAIVASAVFFPDSKPASNRQYFQPSHGTLHGDTAAHFHHSLYPAMDLFAENHGLAIFYRFFDFPCFAS